MEKDRWEGKLGGGKVKAMTICFAHGKETPFSFAPLIDADDKCIICTHTQEICGCLPLPQLPQLAVGKNQNTTPKTDNEKPFVMKISINTCIYKYIYIYMFLYGFFGVAVN